MNTFGNSMAKTVVKNVAGDMVDNAKMQMKDKQSKIEWNSYNWPPFVKMFHFNLEECEPEHESIVKKVHWSWRFI